MGDYLDYLKHMNFDSYTTFVDEVPLDIGKRRGKQSIMRTKNWMKKHIECAEEVQGKIIATIQVSDNLQFMEEQLQMVNLHKDLFYGVNIAGLYLGESEAQRNAILNTIFTTIPETMLRFVTGPNTPFDVLETVRQGSDLVVCSYPVSLAEKAYLSW